MKLLSLTLLMFATITAAQELEISNQKVRLLPPNSPATAAFMTIKNKTKKIIKIKKAKSNYAKSTEIHNHTMIDGMMKMREIDYLEIPAMGEISLKPGGLHIMLIGLTKPLKENEKVDLEFFYDDKKSIKFTAPIQRINKHHHH